MENLPPLNPPRKKGAAVGERTNIPGGQPVAAPHDIYVQRKRMSAGERPRKILAITPVAYAIWRSYTYPATSGHTRQHWGLAVSSVYSENVKGFILVSEEARDRAVSFHA
jgi:hypothetical protein